ncbi:FecCD family ABC transporter permease [Kribbella solani]|uniref:Iron complex transport system permease protein n=1 Tax=Kribbella solani TaxID=236067 RepID=A0A841E013_9ACTN|nr:iron chelate uptake ABC transporter family permease subunit [Kribbella solani]MBB5982340.1 iron complex transport system permease protein [Kribbella solani]MDX2970491.1 iron chelate uptake ABC transporter family permease subunit [Kribbella solani]MDX3003781.1 iron chelate uptake ABC transporter family permease subunit [Kribbella solani]
MTAEAVHVISKARAARQTRSLAVIVVLAVVVFATFCVSLSLGDFKIPVIDVVKTLFGGGDKATEFIVNRLRLPRALTGLLVGTALGLSGAIFQSIARNPLASPDIIGVTYGASAFAVFAIVTLGLTGVAVSGFAIVGAVLTAFLMYVLAWRHGVSSYRLILIGIGIGAMATSVTSYLLTKARVEIAQQALVWLTGSLNGRDWSNVRSLAVTLVVLLPLMVFLVQQLRILQLGDETAYGLGLRVEVSRLGLIVIAVLLAAVATAAAGPIGFVAFVAPPIARRLTRSPGPAMIVSGLLGALVVALSDLVAQHAFGDTQLPVGVVTGVVGAPYLMFLLARANRVGSGG